MARRKDHNREELKDLILAAGWAIIAADGIGALTARRIATDIGYAAGTIYNVFPSMDDLLLHLNGRTLDLLLATLAHPDCQNPQADAATNMKKMAQLYVDFARDYRPFWMALFSAELGAARYEEEWYHGKVLSLFGPLEHLFHSAFPSMTAAMCKHHARILWSSGHGLTYLSVTGKLPSLSNDDDLKAMFTTLIDTYLAGVRAGA